MADPDLQISGGDGEGGSPDIRTELVSRNFCFRSLGPHFGLKISGGRGRGGGGRLPWIRNFTTQETFAEVLLTDFMSFQKYSLQPSDRQCGKA